MMSSTTNLPVLFGPKMSKERQTEVIRAQLVSKAVLRPDETELYELSQLAGIIMDPQVFKILLDLLKLNVPPVAIIQTLRSMCLPHHHGNPAALSAGKGHPHHITILSHGDSSHGLQSLSHHIDSSHLSSGDGYRSGSHEHHGRSSSRDRGRQQNTSKDLYDGRNSSSYSSASMTHDNYSTSDQTNSTSDTTYGSSYRSRSLDKQQKQNSASHIDSSVTRQRNITSVSNYGDPGRKKQ